METLSIKDKIKCRKKTEIKIAPATPPLVQNKTDALALANECRIFPEVHESYEPYEPTVLKMVLGGEIMQGTASKVSNVVPDKNKTFAGTEVLSFEEV